MLKTLTIFLSTSSIALAQQASPTLEARMFQVCQEQRNAAMTWHAGSEAQRAQLVEEVAKLHEEIRKLTVKLEEAHAK